MWLDDGELDEQQDLKAEKEPEELDDEVDLDIGEEHEEQLVLLLSLLGHLLLEEEWHG